MRSDYDVSNLIYGAQTAAEFDFYQGEPKPRLEPLLLDTVMQGRPPVSNCRLLQMPNEILAKIVSFVAEDEEALQELARVNSDCCGLSRACQFSDFTLDYSRNKQVHDIHPGVWRRFQEDPDEEYGGTAEIKEQGAELFKQIQLVGSWDQEHGYLGEGVPPRPNPTNDFFKSLFQLCSQTLESLTWESWHPEAWEPLSLGTDSNTFPKLRKLRIKPGRDLFEEIIRSHVEEPYRDLEELVVEFDDNQQLITELILKHNNLKKLWVTQSYYMSGRDNSFDRVLIPGLGKGRFNNLRSLYIQWGGQTKDAGREANRFDIMPESLAAICELTSLEQLGLRCDEMIPEFTSYEDYTDDTFPIWLIDHEKLQAHLQSLKNLKMLVIRGDTYPSRVGESSRHTGYYRQAYANPEDFQTAKDHPELAPFVEGRDESRLAWQHAHLYRMLEYARSYRAVLPKLEWRLCGQRPMKFIENAQGVVQPHPIGKERDECKSFIGRVFGLASEVEIAHLKE
ncbi:hypothetical protein DER44DRAFT_902303 [Fusarium oxysporum]|nr:hypothetical protein DER44DRAFT_902303 [Fusarium oxysporum]